MNTKDPFDTIASHPCLSGIFIESTIEEVASYFRGEAANVVYRGNGPLYEVHGDEANVADYFGPDSHLYPTIEWLEDYFLLRGSHRVSVVSSNPEFVFVETFCNSSWPYLAQTLHEWTAKTVLEISSSEGPNEMLQTPVKLHHPVVFPESMFQMWHQSLQRSVIVSKESNRWSFRQTGDALPFENLNYYQSKRKVDRLNRAILFEYIASLGIDPFDVFIDRNLEKPILFTSDHVGQNVKIFESERRQYVEFGENRGLS